MVKFFLWWRYYWLQCYSFWYSETRWTRLHWNHCHNQRCMHVWQLTKMENFAIMVISSRQRCKKAYLKFFAKFTWKHLCQSLFLDKAAGLRLWHRSVPVNFANFSRTFFFHITPSVAASKWSTAKTATF